MEKNDGILPHEYVRCFDPTSLEYMIDVGDRFRIFLAGTIDNGNSINWQNEVISHLKKEFSEKEMYASIYNPRRSDWNPNASTEELDGQIEWELEHLEKSDLIIMNILDDSKSPISLMELGLFARKGNVLVFCTPKFYRYENVKLVCNKYGVKLFNTTDSNTIQKEILNKLYGKII